MERKQERYKMIVSKYTPLQLIEIWQPRYKDRMVLLATYKVKEHNKIVFTKAKHLADKVYYISGSKAKQYETTTNGKLSCYEVPLDDLEILEYKEDLESVAVQA